MSHRNLIVVVNAAKANLIKKEFPEHEIYTDAELFSILNGDRSFLGTQYRQDDFTELCQKIESLSLERKVLIHTFNPLFINLLEAYAVNEDGKSEFSMALSEERFFILNNDQKFVSLLKHPEFAKKIDILHVGEAVCDSYLSKYM